MPKLDFLKFDEKLNVVYGWASVITKNGEPVIDHQGDIVPLSELRKAAHSFVMHSRVGGEMHKSFDGRGEIVESAVITPEVLKAIGVESPPDVEGWWIGYKIKDPAIIAKVKNGDYRAFSIGGRGMRTPVSEVLEKAGD